jgi:hypothetical protein
MAPAVDLVNADRKARGEAPLSVTAIPLDDAGISRSPPPTSC